MPPRAQEVTPAGFWSLNADMLALVLDFIVEPALLPAVALADQRCGNYGTCGSSGTAITGTAKVNLDLLEQFQIGRNELIVLNCAAASRRLHGAWPISRLLRPLR